MKINHQKKCTYDRSRNDKKDNSLIDTLKYQSFLYKRNPKAKQIDAGEQINLTRTNKKSNIKNADYNQHR